MAAAQAGAVAIDEGFGVEEVGIDQTGIEHAQPQVEFFAPP